jgi:hypothetical protein
MQRDNAKALERHAHNVEKARRSYIRAARARALQNCEPEPSDDAAAAGFVPEKPPKLEDRIHQEETELTLLLACMFKLFLAFRFTDNTLSRAEAILQRYLLLYKKVN